jgi:SAM-dependent methyltransferase
VAALAPRTRFARLHRELSADHEDHDGRSPRLNPIDLFEAGLRGERVYARTASGDVIGLDVTRWRADADEVDRLLLSRCEPPVLDLGCGPGRLVAAVAETGAPALGIDVSGLAATLTAARGASVLRRALELPLPGHGRWGTILLADGNIGIGGDPSSLLTRCFGLLRPGGLLLVESDPDDAVDTRERLVLHGPRGGRSLPMPWARQGAPALTRTAEIAGFVVSEEWRTAGRVFLALRRPGVDGGWAGRLRA